MRLIYPCLLSACLFVLVCLQAAPSTRPSAPVGAIPVSMPPPLDLSRVTSEQWAGILSQVKEGLALIYGEMSDEQLDAFDAQWAPFYEFPSSEVLAYFSQMQPLVSEFVFLKEAAGKTVAACDQAQFKLTAALVDEDFEEATAHAYSLRQSQQLFLSQNARLQQLSEAVLALGEPPKPAELKAKARRHHLACIDLAQNPPAPIEGVWKGKGVGTWTIQILQRFPRDLLLVDTGAGGRGLLQPLNEPNAWLLIQGDARDTAQEARPWRLDIRGDKLRLRRYTPPRHDADKLPGDFDTSVCQYAGPLTQRESYDPSEDIDDLERPINWTKLFDERWLEHAKTIEVLRSGGLPREGEMSRRRAWALDRYSSEVQAVIERMEQEAWPEKQKALDKEMAEGRAIERMLAEQYYYYGDNPPGFDNCKASSAPVPAFGPSEDKGSAPDFEARRRRQGLLLWALRQRLEALLKIELNLVARRYDLSPDRQSSDLKVLDQSLLDGAKSRLLVEAEAQRLNEEIDTLLNAQLGRFEQQQTARLKEIETGRVEKLRYYEDMLSRERAQKPSSEKDREEHYRYLRSLETQRSTISPSAEESKVYAQSYYRELIEAAKAEAKQRKERVVIDQEEALAALDMRVRSLQKRRAEIASKTVRRLTARGDAYELVPLAQVLAEAKAAEEAAFDLKGYLLGLMDRLDAELPSTKGQSSLESLSFQAIDGACQMELPSSLSVVSRKVYERASPTKGVPAVSLAELAQRPDPAVAEAKLRREAEALAKNEKIQLFNEEIKAFNQSLERVDKLLSEVSGSPDDKDRVVKLEGLARDRLVLEANIKAANDHIRTLETGVYQRTRTAWDDLNQQIMMEDSRAVANHWEQVNRRLDRFNRLLETAKPGDRSQLRSRWNDVVEGAIKNGCNFDPLEKAAREIGEQIQTGYLKDKAVSDAEASSADLKLRIAEGVKTTADTSLTFLTIYATAGLASPAAFYLPVCAESALSTAYSTCTGYIQGGPEMAFKQAAGAFSQVAGLTSLAMDSYQQGVLSHLEDYANNPQKAKLDESGAGLSAMGWAFAETGARQAAMGHVGSPLALNLKRALNARAAQRIAVAPLPSKAVKPLVLGPLAKSVPKAPVVPPGKPAIKQPSAALPDKPEGGIFGPGELRFKSANELRQERLFRDKDLYGKHLMQQFKKAKEDIQNARGAGKADFEIKELLSRAEQTYRAANSDFHAKNWMKRAAKQDPKLGELWCDFDGASKGEVIMNTQALLQAKGLSVPELRCFSNSASKGGVGMDLDLGLVEPPRWLEVPHWKNPNQVMKVANPAYAEWRKSLTMTDPVTGKVTVLHPSEYARHARQAMQESYVKVYGHKPDEAFLEFTFSDHPEAYKDTAWLGRVKRAPDDKPMPWADFAAVNPAQSGQAAAVTGFKVDRLQPGGMPAAGKVPNFEKHGDKQVSRSSLDFGHDELASMPKYSRLLEQSRGLVKDMDTKLFGSKADTAVFGNEAGNQISINPEAPLARMPKKVQDHFVGLRTVLNDLASGRLTPLQAERQLYVLTGGQGIVEVPQQMKIVFENQRKR